jgi:hypothetical protein
VPRERHNERMAGRLTPIGWIAKFIVVPAALGALGFYVIGPRIGAIKPAAKVLPGLGGESGTPAPTEPAVPSETKTPKLQDHPPDGVQVSVRPTTGNAPNLGQDSDADSGGDANSDNNPAPRTRRRSKASPSMAAPPTDPAPDDGGSAGGPAPIPRSTGGASGDGAAPNG